MLEFGLTMVVDFVVCDLLSSELPFGSCLSVFIYLWVHLYTSNSLSNVLAFCSIGTVALLIYLMNKKFLGRWCALFCW